MEPFKRAVAKPLTEAQMWSGFTSATSEILESTIGSSDFESYKAWARDRIDGLVIYKNDQYQVAVYEDGDFIHLSIRRLDRQPIRDWRDMQEIKNQIVGPENEGVELYPAESRLVDAANQYHMFVLKDPAVQFPFGFNERYVSNNPMLGGKQRVRP